jgi:ribosomal protein S18 acetylase RimI-like enzyme
MTDFTSEFIPQLSGTDYMAYAIKTNHLLIEEGHADRDILAVNYDDSAFICLYGGEPVGILVFSITPWRKEVTIKLGRVQPEFRKMGIYTALWNRLVDYAGRKECTSIRSAVKFDNKPMRRLLAEQGRHEESIHSVYYVKVKK